MEDSKTVKITHSLDFLNSDSSTPDSKYRVVRFPSMAELVRTGIVRSDEANRIGEEDSLDMFESNWFIPLKWSVEVLKGAQKEGLIKTPPGEKLLHKKCFAQVTQSQIRVQGRTLRVQLCKKIT